jgi:hypothetical protein
MRITSVHGKNWYVAIICYDRRYGIRILRDVPWDKWCGIAKIGIGRFGPRLYCGDNPEEYLELRRIWDEYKTFCDHTQP